MTRLVALAFAATLLMCAGALWQPPAGAQPSRVVDRTLLCATGQSGGIYEIEARSYTGTRQSRSRWARLPFAVVSTGDVAAAAKVLQNSLAWVSAGRPHATTVLGDYFYPPRASVYGTLALNRRICRTVSTRIPLSSTGLSGGAAGQLGETFDCESPRRVLVRVRATLAEPGALVGHDIFLLTTTPIREARLAVRTQSGKPLAYATVSETGKSTLHTAKKCLPE